MSHNGLVLSGLRGSHLLGFLATLGVLKICSSPNIIPQPVKLGWIQGSDWNPVLQFEDEIEFSKLLELLKSGLEKTLESPLIQWQEDLRIEFGEFRDFSSLAVEERDMDTLSFLAALDCDAVLEEEGTTVLPTPFYTLSGQQRFFKELRKSLRALSNPGRRSRSFVEVLEETLLGPWRYEDKVHSLGWDASTERQHAYRATSPSEEGTPFGVMGAIWLGYEGLSLMSLAPGPRGLSASGFHGPLRNRWVTWPIWEPLCPLYTVRSLLRLQALVEKNPNFRILQQRGVSALYRSKRQLIGNKGYAIFKPADLVN